MNPNQIPKDLPKTDPLLFSFLTILAAAKLPYHFGGGSEMLHDLKPPVFTYSVTSESVDSLKKGDGMMTISVTAVVWDSKPKAPALSRIWQMWANKKKIGKTFDASWYHPFSAWKSQTRDNLLLMIRMLTTKDCDLIRSNKVKLLADLFQWELEGDVQIRYATKQDANDIHGMAAFFRLSVPYSVCCTIPVTESGKEDLEGISREYLQGLGFEFNDC